jgi:large subunit ribosomal protein L3
MIDALLGKKAGMTSVYNDEGTLVPVTVIELGPCTVVQVKRPETDGYTALQIGFEDRKPKNVKQPVLGHYARASEQAAAAVAAANGAEEGEKDDPDENAPRLETDIAPKRFLREVGWDGEDEVAVGQVLTAELFADETKVDVVGITKGRGFQGVVRRHGFGGGPKTHGQGDRHRAPGSIGQSAYPSRVLKGMRMAGRMGGVRKTVRNLRVVRVDPERNAILVNGPVPGPRTGYVIVRRAGA